MAPSTTAAGWISSSGDSSAFVLRSAISTPAVRPITPERFREGSTTWWQAAGWGSSSTKSGIIHQSHDILVDREVFQMRAVAVYPGQANSIHLAEMDKPSVAEVPGGRGVLVRVLRVGVDGTDKEINAAEYGAAPDGFNFL